MAEMHGPPREEGMVERLQDLVLKTPDMAKLLHELVTLSAAALSVHSRLLCGVTMVRKKKPATVATSHPRVKAMDELQYAYGDGPCLTALRDLETIYIPTLHEESRWPHYCSTAWSEGIRSILSVPLPLEGEASAALNLYAAQTHAFSDEAIGKAQEHAARASKALRLAVRLTQLAEDRENLTAALESRTIIDLATGIIMAQNDCSQDTAVRILRSASNTRNRKLRDVAALLVASVGKDPSVITHFD
ncbi:GAF domain-containing protein [Pseudarthrobacter defluvii]|uniref:GAF and ANTAR domain-containing protein n=1 Tax=Pseudarthrobacter defluvii TaxID=410837 RepID=UPI00277E3652|nr:GAF and ANTAR domain-containing protein [Pseudarthrobacter defluvii]MDQ0768087.1 GAF domain-containing protein [Pseudarthrobacter defluvii]